MGKIQKKVNPQGAITNGSLFKFETYSLSLLSSACQATVVSTNNGIRLKDWSAETNVILHQNTSDIFSRMMQDTWGSSEQLILQRLLAGDKLTAVSNG